MPSLDALRCRHVLDPAREPLLWAAREGAPDGSPPPAGGAPRRRPVAEPSTDGLAASGGPPSEIEARAIAGLALPRLLPPTAWRPEIAPEPRPRLQALAPAEVLAWQQAQRAPLGARDLALLGLGGRPRGAAARTRAGLVDGVFLASLQRSLKAATPSAYAYRWDDLWFFSAKMTRALSHDRVAALQPAAYPVVAPSLTSIERLPELLRLVREDDGLRPLAVPEVQAALHDILTLAWAEGRRAQLLGAAERIADDVAQLERRLAAACARAPWQGAAPDGAARPEAPNEAEAAAADRHGLLAALGVACDAYESTCARAVGFGTLLRLLPDDPPLRHLLAAECALLGCERQVRDERIAAGLPPALACRHAFADPRRQQLLAQLQALQAPVQRVVDGFNAPRRSRDGGPLTVDGIAYVDRDVRQHRDALARVRAYAR